MNHRYLIIPIVCMLIFIISACNQEQEQATTGHTTSAEEVQALDNQTNISEDTPIISAVSLAITDEENNIYLVDPRSMEIHSYTNDLEYRWTTGGQGSGPGLFTMISALYVDEQHLYVYDFGNATMTLFTLTGDRLREWSFGEGGHRIENIRRMNTGEFVAIGWNEENGTLAHIYSDDLKQRTAGFVEREEIFNTESPNLERRVANSFPGSVTPIRDTSILYAPAAYNGKLLIYERDPENWAIADTVDGYTSIETPLIFHKSSDGNNERSHQSGFHPDGGYYHTEFTSMSRGLYELESGQIAHLSLRLNENDGWNVVIEYFDPENMELQDYKIIEGLIPSQQLEQLPIWMDGDGQIYMSEHSDRPLRVLRISEN